MGDIKKICSEIKKCVPVAKMMKHVMSGIFNMENVIGTGEPIEEIQVNKTPLSKIMQGIQQVYTQKYNKKNNRTGHVFQQRYKAILCNMDGYLIYLTKYIHMNPVKAGIIEGINYKWSSYREYIFTNYPFLFYRLNILMYQINI